MVVCKQVLLAIPLLGLLALWFLSQCIRQVGSWIMDLGELMESAADHGFHWILAKNNRATAQK